MRKLPKTKEPGIPTSLVLRRDQAFFLDTVCLGIKKQASKGFYVNRSAIVRALIDWLAASKIDVSKAKTEADIVAILKGECE